MASVASTSSLALSFRFQRTLFDPSPLFLRPTIRIRCAPLSRGVSRPAPSASPYIVCSSTSTQTPLSINQEHSDHGDDDDNVFAEFLRNECGLIPREVSKVIRVCSSLSKTRPTQNARELVEVLKECGFPDTQLKHTIVKSPSVLYLKSQIVFLKSLGFTKKDLASFLKRAPRLLGTSIETNLTTKVLYLENLFGSKENLSKAIRRSGYFLLTADIEEDIKPKLEVLKQSGIQDKSLFHLLLMLPSVLTNNSVESLKLKIEYVKKLGILEDSKSFTYTLYVATHNEAEIIEKRLRRMESRGLSEDEVRQLIRKTPPVLNLSTYKLQENIDFLTRTAGLPLSVTVRYPIFLKYSVEKRLKPRYEVFKALGGKLHDVQPSSLTYLFKMSEKAFFKFLRRSPKAARIYKTYRRKSIPSGPFYKR